MDFTVTKLLRNNHKLSFAKGFAAAAHASQGQVRKYTSEPYLVHVIAVEKLVSTVTENSEVKQAAFLHDVLEDTTISYELLLQFFDKPVCDLVKEVTNVSKKSDGNRATRKEIDRQFLAKASPEAQTIKLADIIDNCGNIIERDPEFAKVYIPEKKAVLEILTKGDSTLLKMAQDILTRTS